MPYNSRRGSFHGRTATRPTFHGRSNSKRSFSKETIDPSRFIKPAKPVTAAAYQPTHTFADFAMHDLLKENVQTKGLQTPSPIQDQAIPAGLAGNDIIGIANTGTGKTIAFALPVLHKLIINPDSKVLIMAPTRELAQQIEDECKSVGKRTGLFSTLLIGGTAITPQLRDLRHRPRVIIGTPGRIKDHLERGSLDLSHFDTVVLDEVDRMLDMGFVGDMREILGQFGSPRQSFFFSATLDNRVRSLIDSFASDPVMISVKTSEASDNVEQNVVRYRSRDEKLDKLHDTLIHVEARKVLVFDETQRSVERLSKELETRGFSVDAIHGGKTQKQRQKALDNFKASKVTVLVATDVAARGIDVSDITHVVNYALPQTYADYVHRIGRAGRAGRTGHALTFIQQ